jgi:hypothetical protein
MLNRPALVLLRRATLVLSLVAGLWTGFLHLVDGISITLGPLHASSRNTHNPTLLAEISAVAFALLTWRLGGRDSLREEGAWWWHWLRPWWQRLRLIVSGGARACWWLVGMLPVLVAVAAAAIDTFHWARQVPFWLDDEMIAINVRDRSFTELTGTLWLGQSAPYGWLVVERAIMIAFGSSERALRFMPLTFGLATLAATIWIGRRWLTRFGALALVLMCWISEPVNHYRYAVKHYTADMFFALLLPALAVWAMEPAEGADRRRRAIIWWSTAAAAQWCANGALLVTPACAICLLVFVWRRDGRREGVRFASAGLVWLASVGLHYLVAMQYTVHSEYLRSHWKDEIPPPAAGLVDTTRWLANRIAPLANNPGGTHLFISLWSAALAGFVVSYRRFGAILGTITLSAFAFAAVRAVPLYQRFSLWIVPALYLGVALLIDRAGRFALDAAARRRFAPLALGVLVAGNAAYVVWDITERGRVDHEIHSPADSHHGLDDRSAVRWLMTYREPGDALAATQLTWPALWWYGQLPVPPAEVANERPRNRPVMYELIRLSPDDCPGPPLGAAFQGRTRVLAYLGFRDIPEGFDDVLLRAVADLGSVVAYREFADISRAVVVDLRADAPRSVTIDRLNGTGAASPPQGCVGVRPMRRW